jgi:hypothetical protein
VRWRNLAGDDELAALKHLAQPAHFFPSRRLIAPGFSFAE